MAHRAECNDNDSRGAVREDFDTPCEKELDQTADDGLKMKMLISMRTLLDKMAKRLTVITGSIH